MSHLLKLISSDRFLQKQGLGNEVPFFICPFPPQRALEMETTEEKKKEDIGKKSKIDSKELDKKLDEILDDDII